MAGQVSSGFMMSDLMRWTSDVLLPGAPGISAMVCFPNS
jgi:hypothetical protein